MKNLTMKIAKNSVVQIVAMSIAILAMMLITMIMMFNAAFPKDPEMERISAIFEEDRLQRVAFYESLELENVKMTQDEFQMVKEIECAEMSPIEDSFMADTNGNGEIDEHEYYSCD